MADGDVTGPVPERFQADKMYRVRISEAYENGGFVYVPGAQHTVNGEIAEAMRSKLIAVSEAD